MQLDIEELDIPEPMKEMLKEREKSQLERTKKNVKSQIHEWYTGDKVDETLKQLDDMPDWFFYTIEYLLNENHETFSQCEELQEWYDNCPFIPGW